MTRLANSAKGFTLITTLFLLVVVAALAGYLVNLASALWSAAPYLPVGAHVAVVDPGVGTARKGIAMRTARGDHLVGPDNGLLMPAAARLGGITAAHLLEEPRYALPDISTSFHGRDIFAPAGIRLIPVVHEQGAAHMADGYSRVSGRHGVTIGQNGPGISNCVTAIARSSKPSPL